MVVTSLAYFGAISNVDASVQAAIVTGVCAIVGTYLTVKYKDRVVAKGGKPRDRMDTIFDGYEKLIEQQQEEISRKVQTISTLESAVVRLEAELDETRKLLTKARDELLESKEHNISLRHQLEAMKRDYNATRRP